MNFFRTVIERPVMTSMLVFVMLVMGIYSYTHLVTELIPKIERIAPLLAKRYTIDAWRMAPGRESRALTAEVSSSPVESPYR